MLKVAIVGNIASGKTTVEKFIEEKGFKVYDTDKIAHEILQNSDEVKKEFGTLDRKKIGEIVFSNPDKLAILESIIHPQVKKELEKLFAINCEIVFISVPQLFEAGLETMFDKIIYITANENIRKERLIKRNNFTPEEAQTRINAQSEIGKKEKCDFVIENNGDLNELKSEIENTLETLGIL